MIKEYCFTPEWLNSFKKQRAHKKIDKGILEKMIYALHLLEQLRHNGLDFVFKGGTALLLLLNEGNRFSIDIDIICNSNREKLEAVLEKLIKTSKFKSFELDKHRSYKSGVPKAHYAFTYNSVSGSKYSGTILLDVLFEDNLYPELIEKPLQTKWIKLEKETLITVPSIDAITGDKLTAFAPDTIGVPYFKGRDKQSFSLEIIKQLYDLGKLFEKIEDINVVARSYDIFARAGIAYRGLDITPERALLDTINTCAIIAKRGKGTLDEKHKFSELQKGIKAFGTGFLMTGHFRIDDAIATAARIAYLSAKILKNDMSPIQYFDNQYIKNWNIENVDWNFLNKLKRQSDKSAFYYWYKTMETLDLLK